MEAGAHNKFWEPKTNLIPPHPSTYPSIVHCLWDGGACLCGRSRGCYAGETLSSLTLASVLATSNPDTLAPLTAANCPVAALTLPPPPLPPPPPQPPPPPAAELLLERQGETSSSWLPLAGSANTAFLSHLSPWRRLLWGEICINAKNGPEVLGEGDHGALL